MKPTVEDLLAELKKKRIRLSHQRLKVLEYLAENRNHPTADQIYHGLESEIPTLSKTTVYNTLNTLLKAGLARVVSISEGEARFDVGTHNHGHFKCESCGAIYDFDIAIDDFSVPDIAGFFVREKDVYFKGVCAKCLENKT